MTSYFDPKTQTRIVIAPEPLACEPVSERDAVRVACWKTLLRFVWHNARSVADAGYYFGIACREIEPGLVARMLPAERRLILRGKKERAAVVLGFAGGKIYGKEWAGLLGYTPLMALLEGESAPGDERPYKGDVRMQVERSLALRAMLRVAWQSQDTGAWKDSLVAAFKCFTAIASDDRDLLSWVTQTAFAEAFNETRAAFSHRYGLKVKSLKRAHGAKAVVAPGGKSASACEAYRVAQLGNRNRALVKSDECGVVSAETEALDDEATCGEVRAAAEEIGREIAYATVRHGLVLKSEFQLMSKADLRLHLKELHRQNELKRFGIEE